MVWWKTIRPVAADSRWSAEKLIRLKAAPYFKWDIKSLQII